MSPENATKKPTKRSSASAKKANGFTAEERAAMKERAQELKAQARRADGESAVRAKIAEMPKRDRVMAERLHAIIKKSADKFKSRYATLGFNDAANLDDGAMWATSFALKEFTDAEEATIAALVGKAAS